jgi:glycosyltransferase involved in cell wall biosynthesis
MTVYNAEAFLRSAIESVLGQTSGDWELIAVNDGSRDSSAAILASYTDERVRTLSLAKNIGRTPALRHAFDHARGEYIAVLDADDACGPTRLARQVAFLDANPEVALVGSWVKYIDERDDELDDFRPPVDPPSLHDCLGWTNPIVHSSAMYRRALAEAVGGYSLDLAYAQDFGLVLALAERHRLGMLDEFLCSWRIVSNSMTRSPQYAIARGREALMNFERARRLPLSRRARQLNRRVRSVARVEMGVALLQSRSVIAGITCMLRGVVTQPSLLWKNGVVRRWLSRGRHSTNAGPQGTAEGRS